MEALKPEEIARHLSLEPSKALSTQDWIPDTHPHLRISTLIHGDDHSTAEAHPFRVHDNSSGEIHTRILGEPHKFDHERVKKTHADVMAVQKKKNAEIIPAIWKAIPDLDPESEVAELTVKGKPWVGDLVDGKVVNVRPRPEMPLLLVANGDKLVVDASGMAAHHQTALKKALGGKVSLIAPNAEG